MERASIEASDWLRDAFRVVCIPATANRIVEFIVVCCWWLWSGPPSDVNLHASVPNCIIIIIMSSILHGRVVAMKLLRPLACSLAEWCKYSSGLYQPVYIRASYGWRWWSSAIVHPEIVVPLQSRQRLANLQFYRRIIRGAKLISLSLSSSSSPSSSSSLCMRMRRTIIHVGIYMDGTDIHCTSSNECSYSFRFEREFVIGNIDHQPLIRNSYRVPINQAKNCYIIGLRDNVFILLSSSSSSLAGVSLTNINDI